MTADVSGPTVEPIRVLVVEDDAHIRDLVVLHLELEGWSTVAIADGEGGLSAARAEPFDVIVLDIMLPGLDGITLCRAIRRDSTNSETPILMLTARREEADKVLGLDSGADDYLTKPFGTREFVARVRALLRRRARTSAGDARGPVTAADLTIDPARRVVRLAGRDIDLTAYEFDLLYLLASNRGIVFSREAIMRRVWGDETHITERSVDTLIKRVRRKVEPEGDDPRYILTVWGTGYKFAEAPPDA
jgi:DNA-binding response OmpR family regulator